MTTVLLYNFESLENKSKGKKIPKEGKKRSRSSPLNQTEKKKLGPAGRCYKKAYALAKEQLKVEGKDETGKRKCRCGNGKEKIQFTKHGSNKPATVTEITCLDCDGKGEISSKEYFHVIVGKKVWCCCERGDGGDDGGDSSYRASDGNKVFGNDTYLCGDCGMVTQFG